MSICAKCGATIDGEAVFCPKCGAMIGTASNDNEEKWFYLIGTQQYGPVSVNIIRSMIKAGNIHRSTLVWKNGLPSWIEASKSDLCVHFVNVVPEISISVVSPKWLWALAVIPIVAIWLIGVLFRPLDAKESTVVFFLLNSLYAHLDVRELEKAHQNVEFATWLGAILVPVYLYLRAEKGDKNYAPLITWCILSFMWYMGYF